MTAAQLIQEGRKLQRPGVFLRPEGSGPLAAIWHERAEENDDDDDLVDSPEEHCWLTVDASRVPGLAGAVGGYLSIFTDEENCEGGRVEVSPAWPKLGGTELYAHAASVLPPIDAVFARGSEAVEEWIRSCGWDRSTRYNDNFKDAAIVNAYERVWMDEFPIYAGNDVYAALGGWHWPGADDDWHDLIEEQLMVLTVRNSEPWVEAWRMRDGGFRVIQRIT